MATSLGELFLELGLDTETFDRQIGDVKARIENQGKQLEAVLKLCPTVDHNPLIALNKHLDQKGKHVTELNRQFKQKPLKPSIDATDLKVLGRQLEDVSRQYNALSNQFKQSPLTVVVDTQSLKNADRSLDSFYAKYKNVGKAINNDPILRNLSRLNSGGTIKVEVTHKYDRPPQQQSESNRELGRQIGQEIAKSLKPRGGGIGGMLSAPFKIAGRAVSDTFTGAFMSVGESLFKGLGVSGASKNFGKSATKQIKLIDKYVVGLEDYLAALTAELTRSGSVSKAVGFANPRLRINKQLDKLQKMAAIATAADNPESLTNVKEIVEVVPEDKREDFKKDPKAFLSKNRKIAVAIARRSQQLLEELNPQDFIQEFVNPTLKGLSGSTGFISKVQANRAIIEAKERRKNQVLPSFPDLQKGQEGYIQMIGGAMFRRGFGQYQLTSAFEGMFPNRRMLGVNNPDTDPGGKATDMLSQAILEVFKKAAPEIASNQEMSNTIVNALTMLVQSVNPFFRSEAVSSGLANILAAEEQGVDPSKIGTVSYSLGGKEARQLAQALQMLGLGQSKVAALGFPDMNFGGEKLDNFMATLIQEDPLGFAKNILKLGSDANQRVYKTGIPSSAEAHAYQHYFKDPSQIEEFYGFLGAEAPEETKNLSKFLKDSSTYYEVIGSLMQTRSLINTGSFDKTAPLKAFQGGERVTGGAVIAKFLESAFKNVSTANLGLSSEQEAIRSKLREKILEVYDNLLESFNELGFEMPMDTKPEDLYGRIKYIEELSGYQENIKAFREGKVTDENKQYFAGNFDPIVIRQRFADLEKAIAYFKKPDVIPDTSAYKKKILALFTNLREVMQEFIDTGKVSEATIARVSIEPETLPQGIQDLLSESINDFDLPGFESIRQNKRAVPDWAKENQAAIVAYNKILEDMGDMIPPMDEIERVGYGMSGAASFLTKDLVYKTDVGSPDKIASPNEVGAYERLGGRLSPLMYSAKQGKGIITERIIGKPVKDILDELAKPAKEAQARLVELRQQLQQATDRKTRSDLTQQIAQETQKFNDAKQVFNDEAESLYEQIGQLGAALQSMGVAHMDLASANVFKTAEGLKAIDLGNAKVDPTLADRLTDQATTIQRAVIDRAFYGILDPLRQSKAIARGYSQGGMQIPETRTPGQLPMYQGVQGVQYGSVQPAFLQYSLNYQDTAERLKKKRAEELIKRQREEEKRRKEEELRIPLVMPDKEGELVEVETGLAKGNWAQQTAKNVGGAIVKGVNKAITKVQNDIEDVIVLQINDKLGRVVGKPNLWKGDRQIGALSELRPADLIKAGVIDLEDMWRGGGLGLRQAYSVAKGVENVALGAIGGGHMMKAGLRNAVLPIGLPLAAMFGPAIAEFFLPGSAGVLPQIGGAIRGAEASMIDVAGNVLAAPADLAIQHMGSGLANWSTNAVEGMRTAQTGSFLGNQFVHGLGEAANWAMEAGGGAGSGAMNLLRGTNAFLADSVAAPVVTWFTGKTAMNVAEGTVNRLLPQASPEQMAANRQLEGSTTNLLKKLGPALEAVKALSSVNPEKAKYLTGQLQKNYPQLMGDVDVAIEALPPELRMSSGSELARIKGQIVVAQQALEQADAKAKTLSKLTQKVASTFSKFVDTIQSQSTSDVIDVEATPVEPKAATRKTKKELQGQLDSLVESVVAQINDLGNLFRQQKIALSNERLDPALKNEIASAIENSTDEARQAIDVMVSSFGKNVPSRVKKAAKDARTNISKAGTKAGARLDEARSVGEAIPEGVNQGVKDRIGELTKTAEKMGQAVILALKAKLEIRSPSRVAMRIGEMFARGFNLGLGALGEAKESFSAVDRTIKEMVGNLEKSLGRSEGDLASFYEAGKMAAAAFIGFQVIGRPLLEVVSIFGELSGASFQAALQMEKTGRMFTFAYGSISAGKDAMKQVRDESKALGVDLRSSLQGQAQLAAATRGTALEGFTTEALGSAARQTSAVMGLTPQEAERVQLAIQQMASKGKVSAEELRQQLGEALPGAFQIAARALGVTTQELDKMLQRGEVLSEDFLPKFAVQLSAETSTGLAGASESAQASINRLNNAIFEFQASTGEPVKWVQKLGLDGLTVAIEGIQKLMPLASLAVLTIGVAAAQVAIDLLRGSKAAKIAQATWSSLGATAQATGKLMQSGPFLIAAGITLAAMALFKFKESYLDVGKQQRDFAQSAIKGMDDYKKSVANAREELKKLGKDAPPELKNLTPPEKPKNISMETLRGFEESLPITGSNARSQRESIDRLQELAQESVDRRQDAANTEAITGGIGPGSALEAINQLLGAYRGVQGSDMINPDSTIGRIQELQGQIEAAQTRRRALQPGNREGRRAIDLEIEGLQREMAPLRNVLAGLQGNVAANIEFFESERKKALASGDGELAARYQSAIDRLSGATDELNGYLQDSINVVGKLNKEFATIQGTMERANRAIEATTNQNRRSIAQGVIGGASQGVADFARFQSEQDNLSQRATTAQTAFQQMQDAIMGNVEMMEALGAVGITEFDQIEPTQLRNRASGMDDASGMGDSVDKGLLESAADQAEKALSLQAEADNLSTQAVEARAQFVVSMRNLAKQVNDFFVNVANQAKEAQIQAQAIAVQTNTQRAQSKLRQSLIGFQDSFINEFADALVQLVEQLNKPLQDAIGAQSQILQAQQQYFSQIQQAFQMGQQLPGLGQVAGEFGPLPGETMQGVPMPAMDNPYGENGVQRANGEMMGTPATLGTPGASLNPLNPAVNPQAFMQGLQGLEQANPLQATAFGIGGLQNAGQLITQNYEQQIANIQQQLINSQELAAIEAEMTADRANRALFDATRRINDTARQYNRSIEDLLTSGMDKTAFGQLGNGLRQLDRSLEDSIIGMSDFRRQLTATVEQSAMLYQQITEGIASGLLPDTFRDFLPGLERMAADAQSQLANVDRQITQFQEAAQESRRRQIEGFVRDQRKELQTALAENARLSGRGDEGRLIEYGQRIEQQKEELRLQRIELENLRSSGQITNDEFVMMAQNMDDLNAIKMDNIRRELKRTQRDVEFSSRRVQQQLTIDITRARQRSAELANDMASKLFLDAQAQAQELGEAYASRMNDLRSQLESGAIDSSQFNAMANDLQLLNEISLENLKDQFEQISQSEFFKMLTGDVSVDPKDVRQRMQEAIKNLDDLQASGIISRDERRSAQRQLSEGATALQNGNASALRQISDRRNDIGFISAIQSLGGDGLLNLMNSAEAMFTPTNRAIDQGFESGQREADAIRNSATFDSVPDNVARIAMKMDRLIQAVQAIGSPNAQSAESKAAQSPMYSSNAELELAIANL